METPLTIPEELFLLTVNERTGRKALIKSMKFDVLLSAAILMELALRNRIDTDLDYLIPDNPDKTGVPILDQAMEIILSSPARENITYWLLKLAEKSPKFRSTLVSGLISKGLLRMDREKVFLGFSSKLYPMPVNDREIYEVKTRVRKLVLSSELPDFRDMVIVSVAWYGGLLNLIFSEDEIHLFQTRIEQIAKMDLIGQAVTKSLKSLTLSIIFSMRAKEIMGVKSAEEKLDDLVEEMKTLMQIEKNEDLPEWLRRGTAQCDETLDYIRKTGTGEIYFNPKTGKYGLKTWAGLR
ncbi:MAG: GPP34 family phosphoprotein [bacterium]